MKMKYPVCSNGTCMHNDKYLCKAEGLEEDFICKQGKADEGTYESEHV
jgi:hypothetical protein